MPDDRDHRRLTVPFIAAILSAAVAVGVTALLLNIFQRQQEAEKPFFCVID